MFYSPNWTLFSVIAVHISAFEGLGQLIISCHAHFCCIGPSFPLNSYLVVMAVLEFVRLQSPWSHSSIQLLPKLSKITLALQLVIITFESRGKRRLLRHQYRDATPEETIGFFSNVSLLWLRPLLMKGKTTTCSSIGSYPLNLILLREQRSN
jgi:hypothetical protein